VHFKKMFDVCARDGNEATPLFEAAIAAGPAEDRDCIRSVASDYLLKRIPPT
jgi:hypothetical protein